MIFPDYAAWQPWLYCLSGAVLAFAFGCLAKSSSRIRFYVAGGICAGAVVITAVLTLAFASFGVFFEETTHSAPLFSPDHHRAVVVSNADNGALGGSTYVQLYFAHGLLSNLIFVGDFSQTDLKQIRWIDDEHLRIGYASEAGAHEPRCYRSRQVMIQCIASQIP